MFTCDFFMSTCNIIMSTCDLFMSTCDLLINKSHVNIIMLHVDINKSHVNIIMLHVDIIYLACRGQKYATIEINFSFILSINWLSFDTNLNSFYLRCFMYIFNEICHYRKYDWIPFLYAYLYMYVQKVTRKFGRVLRCFAKFTCLFVYSFA